MVSGKPARRPGLGQALVVSSKVASNHGSILRNDYRAVAQAVRDAAGQASG